MRRKTFQNNRVTIGHIPQSHPIFPKTSCFYLFRFSQWQWILNSQSKLHSKNQLTHEKPNLYWLQIISELKNHLFLIIMDTPNRYIFWFLPIFQTILPVSTTCIWTLFCRTANISGSIEESKCHNQLMSLRLQRASELLRHLGGLTWTKWTVKYKRKLLFFFHLPC